jgi:predicted nucleic acid-binding protein
VVVDTSVIFAAAARASRVRQVLLLRGIEWIAPPAAALEIRAHIGEVAAIARLDGESMARLIDELLARIIEVPLNREDPEMAMARQLIGGRDPSDIEFVAAAIKFGAAGIWSLDKDFDSIAGIRRLTTAEVDLLPDNQVK